MLCIPSMSSCAAAFSLTLWLITTDARLDRLVVDQARTSYCRAGWHSRSGPESICDRGGIRRHPLEAEGGPGVTAAASATLRRTSEVVSSGRNRNETRSVGRSHPARLGGAPCPRIASGGFRSRAGGRWVLRGESRRGRTQRPAGVSKVVLAECPVGAEHGVQQAIVKDVDQLHEAGHVDPGRRDSFDHLPFSGRVLRAKQAVPVHLWHALVQLRRCGAG